MRSNCLFCSLLTGILCLAVAVPGLGQPAATLPDVVGIRLGMSPQEAYDILKARSNGAKIGIAQQMIDGIQQPVVVLMALQVLGSSPREEITVYLTYPPQKQVVWSIVRKLTFEPGKEPTKTAIMDGLRQKYGPEIDFNHAAFWSFTEDGQRSNASQVVTNGCLGRVYLTGAGNFENPQPITALPNLQPLANCERYVNVRAELGDASSVSGGLTSYVTVAFDDQALAIRSREAWKALVAGGNAAARQQELEKAKQQAKPTF